MPSASAYVCVCVWEFFRDGAYAWYGRMPVLFSSVRFLSISFRFIIQLGIKDLSLAVAGTAMAAHCTRSVRNSSAHQTTVEICVYARAHRILKLNSSTVEMIGAKIMYVCFVRRNGAERKINIKQSSYLPDTTWNRRFYHINYAYLFLYSNWILHRDDWRRHKVEIRYIGYSCFRQKNKTANICVDYTH